MKQADLDRSFGRATGETVSTIKRVGFLLDEPPDSPDGDSAEHGPYVVDWDELETERYDGSTRRPHHEPAAA